jgi:hypothetical protein
VVQHASAQHAIELRIAERERDGIPLRISHLAMCGPGFAQHAERQVDPGNPYAVRLE